MAKVDFTSSEDGDIVLGQQRVDKDGKRLYLHADGTISTVETRDDGKIGKPLRDFAYSFDRDAIKQISMNRLKTDAPDWYHYPLMGGNLSDLIGEPNTKETGLHGEQLIFDALTYKNLLGTNEVTVKSVPISQHEILFMVTIAGKNSEPYRVPIVFNLNYGIKGV